MKQMTEYNRVSGYLNKLFDKLNIALFEGALSRPIITIQNTPNAYGHVTVAKTWLSGNERRRELNIGAGTLARPIEETVSTLIHEMVHIYNLDNDIKDVSRGGAYHNKRFKEEAEKRWLLIEHDKSYGWTITKPTDKLLEWCIEEELEEIKIQYSALGFFDFGDDEDDNEAPTPKVRPKGKPTSSTRKYICPNCKSSVRATRDISLICGECYDATQRIVYLEKA